LAEVRLSAANSIASTLASIQGSVGQIGAEAAQGVVEGESARNLTIQLVYSTVGTFLLGAAIEAFADIASKVADRILDFAQDSGVAIIRYLQRRESPYFYGALDDLGRWTGARAFLSKEALQSARGSVPTVAVKGAGGELSRGHLIGKQLGGAGNTAANLAPQYQRFVNDAAMVGIENEIRRRVELGETIDYLVIPIYRGDELVPVGFTIRAEGSNGFSLFETVRNVPNLRPVNRAF
jgi:DNA-entry nuclease